MSLFLLVEKTRRKHSQIYRIRQLRVGLLGSGRDSCCRMVNSNLKRSPFRWSSVLPRVRSVRITVCVCVCVCVKNGHGCYRIDLVPEVRCVHSRAENLKDGTK